MAASRRPRRAPSASGRAAAVPRSKASTASYSLLSPTDVLRAIVTFSRGASTDLGEGDLFALLYGTLRELLPGRFIALRRFDPKTLKVVEVLADDGLADGASDMPPTIHRDALQHPIVRDNLPANWRQGKGSGIRVVDQHPLVFRGARAGFSVPLVAGGELTGEVHVNYPPASDARGAPADADLPLKDDQSLVIPLSNHVAVAAHTRRLLRETVYLQGYLEQLIEQANVLIIATDPGGRVTVWNRAMNRLTGFSRTHAVGQDLLPWLTELGAPDVALVIKQVAASGEPAAREVRLPSVGGAVLRAAFNVATVRGSAGAPDAILAIGQDVTALRSLQSQVGHAEKLATVGQIAAGVAHEINNPLTSIQVCAEAVLRKAQLAAESRVQNAFEPTDIDRLKKIQEGAERIRRFARDLVSYARPSGSEVEEVSLNDAVEHALSFCEHILDEARAELDRDLHKSLPPIRAIRDQLLQVVINLVTNAAHALDGKSGRIRVRTWPSGDANVSLAVTDTGTGIRDEDRPFVFEPFFSTKPAGRGTGLGLSVVRNIIYSHGGQISFQTRPGGGTTFIVTLPINHLVSPP